MQPQTRIFSHIGTPTLYNDPSYPSYPSYRSYPAAHEAEWPIFICLLGTFHVLKHGYPVYLHSAKAQTLLSVLAIQHEYLVERTTLLQIMWPGCDIQLARQSLNTLIYNLRKQLGDAIAGAPPVLSERGYYRLNVEAGIGVDIRCFDDLVTLGDCQEPGRNEAASIAPIEMYDRAVRLYHGDLCTDLDQHSIGTKGTNTILERERLRVLYLTALVRLANYYHSNRNYRACIESTQRILVTDPYREDAHRTLMRCYTLLGQRSQALHQYRLCEQRSCNSGSTPRLSRLPGHCMSTSG